MKILQLKGQEKNTVNQVQNFNEINKKFQRKFIESSTENLLKFSQKLNESKGIKLNTTRKNLLNKLRSFTEIDKTFKSWL